MMTNSILEDRYGRKIDYLRISVTDRCNLNCFYCNPSYTGCFQNKREILTFEEIEWVAKAAVLAGITKIRITGGEPLIRRGVVGFCHKLSSIDGIKKLALTTNGVFLKKFAGPLFKAGVSRVNISFDTLHQAKFKNITGHNFHRKVLDGIKATEEFGFHPIKINTVVMRGINDDEIKNLARLTFQKAYHVRFIELMPTLGWRNKEYKDLFMPVSEIFKRLAGLGIPHLEKDELSFGPARLYRLPGAVGRVGLISPMSEHFCESCNRLRLTADGKLRTCLFSNDEINIKNAVRAGSSLEKLAILIREAALQKPEKHQLSDVSIDSSQKRVMCAIGG